MWEPFLGAVMAKRALLVEQPDNEVRVDVLSRHPVEGVRIEEVSVRLKIEYDQKNGASLHIYAVEGEHARILIDQVLRVGTEEPE